MWLCLFFFFASPRLSAPPEEYQDEERQMPLNKQNKN